MSAAAIVPYRVPRITSLFLAFACTIAGLGLGARSWYKRKIQLQHHAGRVKPGESETDNDHIIYQGAFPLVFLNSAALAVVSLTFILLSFRTLAATKSGVPSPRTLRIQGVVLILATLGLLGSLIPLTYDVASKGVKIAVFTGGGTRLPDAVAQSQLDPLGGHLAYHDLKHLVNSVVVLWVAFPFGAISGALSLLASSALKKTNDMSNSASKAAGEAIV